jgi:zinc transport system substrate-binding protein
MLPKIHIAGVLAILMLAGCAGEGDRRPVVIASTTTIASAVEAVAGPGIEVASLVPGGSCPGHFDIKPGQMRALERADILVYHGWEAWLPDLLEASAEDLVAARIGVEGNLMIPNLHLEAIPWILDLVVSLDPAGEEEYEERALAYENEVLQEANALCSMLRDYQAVPVICSELQSDFLTWAGFDILGTYGREESLTPGRIERMVDIGRRFGVRMVVDNLQSGPDTGTGIAEEIGAAHVVLTNFPLEGSYPEALRRNAREIERALR